MKFSPQAQLALQKSKDYAERHRHEFLTAEHLLLILLSEQKIESLLESCGSDVSMVKNIKFYSRLHISTYITVTLHKKSSNEKHCITDTMRLIATY